MTHKDDSVFPSPHFSDVPGINIRQYYAAKAMQGLCANYNNLSLKESGVFDNIVEMSFKIADKAIEFENKEEK